MNSFWPDIAMIITALGTFVLAVATCVFVGYTRKQMRSQFGPFVLVEIKQIDSGSNFFGIVMQNTGKAPAFAVKAMITPENRSVVDEGILKELNEFLNHERPMLTPGQVVCRKLNLQDLYTERNNDNKLRVDVQYALKYGKARFEKQTYDISPSWQGRDLFEPPGTWREVDSRVGKLKQSVDQIEKRLGQIVKAIDQKDDD